MIAQQLLIKESKLAVIGLGYVGLPIALAFARKISVIGFDINAERIELLEQHIDPSKEIAAADFKDCDIIFTNCLDILKEANFFIVAVPTPVDEHNVPDLSLLKKACETVGKVIEKGDCVVFESTVYPGCTEEDCVPIIDKEHTLEKIIKVVSGCDKETLEDVAAVYGLVVNAGIYKASSIKVAEAAKVIENTQRDLNIALMNELSIIFDKIGINTYEVLGAACTKWNFLKFHPGLVGGHCIGVDPYYLTYKASELGFNSRVITAGRYINDTMGNYISKKILQYIILHSSNVKESKVLIMGATFKENVSDIRNSKVADIIKVLQSYYLNVHVTDPLASSDELQKEYGFGLMENTDNDYDVIIIAVPHNEYHKLDEAYFSSVTKEHALIADLKGLYRNKITNRKYWSL